MDISKEEKKLPSTYGSCVEPNDVEILSETGDPKRLLTTTWIELIPVLGPLFVIEAITVFQSWEKGFVMSCKHQPLPVQALCIWTEPSTRWFAMWAAVLILTLSAWRLVHERIFYVLMQRGIVVDFENRHQIGFYVTIFLTIVFLHAIVHFLLVIEYGHPAPGEIYIESNRALLHQLIYKPESFVKEYHHLVSYLILVIVRYIVPSSICLVFLKNLDSLEERLVPLVKYLERDPHRAYQILGKSLYVREGVFRRLLSDGSFKPSSPCDIIQLCQDMERESFRYEGVQLMDEDHENTLKSKIESLKAATGTCRKSITPDRVSDHSIFQALYDNLYEAAFIKWWPVKILLDPGLIDRESISFRRYIGAHFMIIFVIACLGSFKGLNRLRNLIMLFMQGDLSSPFKMVWSSCFCMAATSFMVMVARNTLRYGKGLFGCLPYQGLDG